MTALTGTGTPMRRWPARRWWVAFGVAAAFTVVVAVPTDLVDTPLFGRDIPPTWWSWPGLLLSAALAGLLCATYVATPTADAAPRARRGGYVGGVLTFFAVGCPVCNKLVLLALGTSGALAWFEPAQLLLQVAAIVLLGWALVQRIRGERSCATSPAAASTGVADGRQA